MIDVLFGMTVVGRTSLVDDNWWTTALLCASSVSFAVLSLAIAFWTRTVRWIPGVLILFTAFHPLWTMNRHQGDGGEVMKETSYWIGAVETLIVATQAGVALWNRHASGLSREVD